jgi:hypothetical protein
MIFLTGTFGTVLIPIFYMDETPVPGYEYTEPNSRKMLTRKKESGW